MLYLLYNLGDDIPGPSLDLFVHLSQIIADDAHADHDKAADQQDYEDHGKCCTDGVSQDEADDQLKDHEAGKYKADDSGACDNLHGRGRVFCDVGNGVFDQGPG